VKGNWWRKPGAEPLRQEVATDMPGGGRKGRWRRHIAGVRRRSSAGGEFPAREKIKTIEMRDEGSELC
jgi:hypothetical protein